MIYQHDKQLFLEMMGLLNDMTWFCEQFIEAKALDATQQTNLRSRTKEARELHGKARKFVGEQTVEAGRTQVRIKRGG